MANKKNNKNGIQVHPKQGFFRRNLLKIIAGASITASALGIGAYSYNRNVAPQQQVQQNCSKEDCITALENLTTIQPEVSH